MVPISNRGYSLEPESCDLSALRYAGPKVESLGEFPVRGSLTQPRISTISKPLHRELSAREAVLLTFCDPLPEQCSRLFNLSTKEWRGLLYWLDFSGLALYFLDRLAELDLCDLLPPAVFTRLQLNLIDNTERTRSMISESIAIQQEFQEARLLYANLKGLSLWPSSVPKSELRSQFDLDFLVGEQGAADARVILERRGYRLYAISGRSWEFKLNEKPGLSLKDLYKNLRSYGVELHIEPSIGSSSSPLGRLETRELHGMNMPVLSPVDLLLGQGLHVYKHICGEFSRVSHLLEFRRHVLARRDDGAFWDRLQWTARENPRASLGLGAVTFLISHLMTDFAPDALTGWTVRRLPHTVRLWLEVYGHRIVLGSYPGTKLYLLLQRELESGGIPVKRSFRQALLPSRLPPPVIRAFPNESISVRCSRYRMQLELILLRLRFHIVEGLRYALESNRWQRMKRITQ